MQKKPLAEAGCKLEYRLGEGRMLPEITLKRNRDNCHYVITKRRSYRV
jgi:hypothetical protein